MKRVRYEQGKVPPLTTVQILELHAMAAMSDKSINFEDIPATSAEAWKDTSAQTELFSRRQKSMST